MMEGRPPSFDPDDELDFDFDTSRGTSEDEAPRRRRSAEPGPYEGEEYPSQEYPSDETDDPFAAEPERPERPRRRLGIRLGRRRRSDTAERRRARTGERPAVGAPADVGAASGTDTGEEMVRDDPYTPSEGPAPTTRRARRRDLPAKVRRRQAFGIGGVALAVLLGGFLLLSGGGGGGDEDEGLPVKKLVGQTFVARIGGDGATPELLKKARKGQIGGVFASQEIGDEAQLQAAVSQLQQAASDGDNPPLLVMIDQEGDPIRALRGPPDIAPQELGERADPEVARTEGEKTGTFLAGPGVNVNLAPVLDVELSRTADTIGDRTFGEDPALVTSIGVAFIEGLQSQNVAATAKHFPGLGPATINTDFAPVTVVGQQDELDAALQPFQAAVDAGVKLVMMSSAAYPSYAGATPGEGKVKPAVFAEPIVQGMLRQEMGFDGVVITDDLESIAIKTLTNRDVAAVSALGAGCDLVLYARSVRGATQGFNRAVQAVKKGKLDQAALQQSYDRITRLKTELATS